MDRARWPSATVRSPLPPRTRTSPEAIRESHGNIPWRAFIATRNRVIRAYLGIDDDVIRSIIRGDVSDLVRLLSALPDQALPQGPADDGRPLIH